MRAAIIEGPHRLVVKDDVPEPQPGPDEIKIRVRRAAICNVSDWEVYEGTSPTLDYIGGYPHILGHENAGEVVEVGANVTGFARGDRVAFYWKGTGAFAEFNTLNPGKLSVVKLADNVSFDVGAIMEMAAGGAMRNVWGSGMRPADTVVVMGVGPAGLFTGMVADLFGARAWVALDLIPSRLDKARQLGAAAAFNVGQMSPEEIVSGIWEAVGEVDMVFETVGPGKSANGCPPLDLAVQIVKPGGDIRLFTYAPAPHQISIGAALSRGVNLVGRKVTIEKTRQLMELAHRWIAEGRYRVSEVITHHIPLAEVEDGLHLVHDHPEQALKVVIETG